jgi:hypothetical protein
MELEAMKVMALALAVFAMSAVLSLAYLLWTFCRASSEEQAEISTRGVK